MSAEPEAQPGAATGERAPFLPRWAIYLIVPGLLGPVLILAFILRTEWAHDPKRCPFRALGERTLSSDVRVREDGRQCMSNVAERRFTLLRGASARVLGQRRLSPGAFAAERYHWQASLAEDGEVHVVVHNDGHDDNEFREGTAAEHAQ